MEHKLILGGDEYLPFARSCVTKLKKLGLAYANQSYEVGGVSIKVRIEPGHEYIMIEGAPAGYEFFASDKYYEFPEGGPLMLGTRGATGFGGNTAVQLGCGVGVRAGTEPVPLFANTLAGGKWPMKTFLELAQIKEREESGMLWLSHAANNQRSTPAVWWGNNDPHSVFTSTNAWGVGRTWNSRIYRPYNYSGVHGMFVAARNEWFFPFVHLRPSAVSAPGKAEGKIGYMEEVDRDITKGTSPLALHEGTGMFDIVPTIYKKTGVWSAGHKRTEHANWRRAATVHADNGTEYCVSTDTHGVFSFYKLPPSPRPPSSVWINPNDLPDNLVKVVRVDYPAWVVVEPDTKSTTDDHWQWSFSKGGNRAATTPLNKVQAHVYLTHERRYIINTAENAYAWARTITMPPAGFASVEEGWVRAPLFKLKDPEAGGALPPVVAQILGGLVDFSGWSLTYFESAGISSVAVADPNAYEPMYELTPGFVAVSISITVDKETGEFTPVVEVTDSEAYASAGSFFVDTDFYVRTRRTRPTTGESGETVWRGKGYAEFEPEQDDLLTAEIEVRYTSDNYLAKTGPQVAPQEATPAAFFESIDGVSAAGLKVTGLYVNLVVKRRSDRATVKRLCLAHDVEFSEATINHKDYSLPDDSSGAANVYEGVFPKTFVGVISQMNLRFLSFMTTSYCRRKTTYRINHTEPAPRLLNGIAPPTDASWVSAVTGYLKPRFEVRIHGEKLLTVDYSEPHLTGFSNAAEPDYHGPDPMSSATVVPGTATDQSLDPTRRYIALYLKQYFAGVSLLVTHLDFMSFSPSGSWSVYSDRRGLPALTPEAQNWNGHMTIQGTSTTPSGVFDVISPRGGKKTTHKAMFNKAFNQSRDYEYWSNAGAQVDYGGFATHGIWY